MLKEILSASTCAKCRNCCMFLPQSAWELPSFDMKSRDRLQVAAYDITLTADGSRFSVALHYDAAGEAQPCPFLDANSGCTLPLEEKPFACSLWPVRVMQKDGKRYLTMYRGCDGLPETRADAVKSLLQNGLSARITKELEADPTLLLPYHENYLILQEIECQEPDE
ncbi:MAG: YkgJ family cysteine cluster protein [Oscillospiraceae bacterium]|nr:YkgJ family cysteine cluster protein [Oscillospiraceae bacterium]